jgi:fatty-acyl-CoA synthase
VDNRATVFVYIGELCRYLVNQPPGEVERKHTLRCGFGNGLRADVWAQFAQRFGVSDLIEFYGATEGNVGLINFDAFPGAVGRIPPWLKGPMSNVRIVRHDADTVLPVRGPDGLCVEAGEGETGEMIGRIGVEARQRFDGYGDADETARKVISDVFSRGDAWFRTGDLMRRDGLGYVYFVDRIGDTFRWKGENVSTREVENVLCAFPGIVFANVYGVSVPGEEGRAGMAALSVEGPLDLAALARHLQQNLQPAAIPVYLRLDAEMDTTQTLKLRKGALQAQGFDPQLTGCPVWTWDRASGGYTPLNPA